MDGFSLFTETPAAMSYRCGLAIFQLFSSKKRHKYEIMQNGVPYFFLKGRV